MIEYLAPGFIYSVAKDIWARVRSHKRKLSAAQVVELRKKWKGEFEPRIWEWHQKKLRDDIIIRDMKRFDSYPDIDENAKGISPWFRAGLVGTYHKGIQVGLSWHALTKHGKDDRWRRANYEAGETGDINVLLIGLIPYENIENVDWDGDEYYNYPHIYCFFSYRKEPYEHLGYYTQTRPLHGLPFYTEVASYDSVRRLGKKLGIVT
jgi:hypothetical protein